MGSRGQCEHCACGFRYDLIHNGFNDSAYAYCDKCSFTVLLNWNTTAEQVGLALHRRIESSIEPYLKPCPCGGAFRASADPNAPIACGRCLPR